MISYLITRHQDKKRQERENNRRRWEQWVEETIQRQPAGEQALLRNINRSIACK